MIDPGITEEDLAAGRELLKTAGIDPSDLTDDEVVERVVALTRVISDVGNALRPIMASVATTMTEQFKALAAVAEQIERMDASAT